MNPSPSGHRGMVSPHAMGLREKRKNSPSTPALGGEARVSDQWRISIGSVPREPMAGTDRVTLQDGKPGRQLSLKLSLSAQRKWKIDMQ